MVQTQAGIVLKNHLPQRHMLTLLDYHNGKIEGTLSFDKTPERLKAGMVLVYHAQAKQLKYRLDHVDIIHTPSDLARTDIGFLHQMLEICHYFLPYHCIAQSVFNRLQSLLLTPNTYCAMSKKVLLLQLFADLGLYPEDEWLATLAQMKDLHYNTITFSAEQQLMIDRWIGHCIMVHPARNQFKTMTFEISNEPKMA
jgi:hypothetical protein